MPALRLSMLLWSGVLMLLGVIGCDARTPVAPTPLRVVFSGGCMVDPAGGAGGERLPAIGGYVAGTGANRLVVDVGSFSTDDSIDPARAQAVMRTMRVAGYDAANVGRQELRAGYDNLRLLAAQGVPMVSANVWSTAGEPAVAAALWFRRDGITVAVTGVVQPDEAAGQGLTTGDPARALGHLLPQLARHAELVLVLADLPVPQARDLLERFPEIGLMLVGDRSQSGAPQQVNRSVLASVDGHDLCLGDLTVHRDTNGGWRATGEAVRLAIRPLKAQAPAEIDVARNDQPRTARQEPDLH